VKRLLYIHNIAMPGPEANTVNVAKMCSAFAANGCAVTLATLPGAPSAHLAKRINDFYGLSTPFTVAPLQAWAARPSLAALAGAILARRGGADIAYTRAPHAAFAACLAGVPTALEVHTDPAGFGALGLAAYKGAITHPKLIGLIAISDALARRLAADTPRAPIFVAHDGADSRPPAHPAQHGEFRVGYVGRFYRGKGLELVGRLATLCAWAQFHIVGGDQAAAEAIMGMRAPANVVVHGSLPHAEAAEHIDACDVVLAPYQRSVIVADGKTDAAAWMSPLKIFEYMAAGKAILASDLPVLREILHDGENALLLAPEDAEAWSRALQVLRDDPARRDQLGSRARTDLLARHTWTQRASRILGALRQNAPQHAARSYAAG
jgi:glycosyltransferase involved in cell wall biosynthesis